MNKTASETILKFLGFNERQLEEVSYLINVGSVLGCKESLKQQLFDFDPKGGESFPIFYKRMFISELSWWLTQLVCATYYPEQAIKDIEDFGIFFQDIWLSDEENNVFYDFWLKTDLRQKTKREIVELNYEYLKNQYETFFKYST